jgi:hypothetical protein
VSGWSCKFDVNGICERVDGAYCRPGMKGCILQGKVEFHDGVVPSPVWPPGHERSRDSGRVDSDPASPGNPRKP